MYKATTLLAVALLIIGASTAMAQDTVYLFEVPLSEDFKAAYSIGDNGAGVHSAARSVFGPVDLDNDGQMEVLVSDYSGGGRVHVIENTGVNTWEWVYSTPWVDSTATTENIRAIAAGDLDGDGNGEIFFLAGRGYSETNPNIDQLPVGLYVYEFNGTDFGDLPVSVYEFDGDLPDRFRTEQMAVADVDNDGSQELMFGNNGRSGRWDNWYILSITGDFGSGFEVWVEEARLSSRASEEFDPVNRGGGSPYAIHPADLDGDGALELTLHSWNCFNLTNGQATDADTYEFPGEGATNGWIHAAGPGLPCVNEIDHVAFFGGVVIDMDGNGDDEIYFANLQTADITVLNYEEGEDILQITEDNYTYGLIPNISTLGIAAGDLDGDGRPGIFGTGPSYSAGNAGNPPTFVRVAEFTGGDVEDSANYAVSTLDFFEPFDTLSTNFDRVISDSAGVITEFLEETDFNGKNRGGGHPGQGPLFVSKMAFLGDIDGNGRNELAIGFQGIDDSTYVLQETFNPADSSRTRVITERRANEHRVFLRIIESSFAAVATEDRNEVPSGYILSANYPNPFNPSTSFTFTLPLDKRISIRIYDITGRLVRTLVNGEFYAAGTHQATWDGANDARMQVASGTYLYTLEHGNFRQSRTMLLIK